MKLIKRLINLTLVSLTISAIGLPAIAQPPSSPPPSSSPNRTPPPHPDVERPGMSPLELLQLEQVQKELGLTQEQMDKLKKLAEQQPPPPQNQRSRGLGQQPPITAEQEQVFAQQAQAMRQQIEEVLDQEQLNRLRGFLIQANGFIPELNRARTRGNAPDDPLKLTPEQREKIADIQAQTQQSARNALQTARTRGNNPASTCQKLEEINEQSTEEIMSVLSQEQQEALEELQGPKLDLPNRTCNP